MTTITIESDLPITRTKFRDELEFLAHLAEFSGYYSDPDFRDTIVTKEIIVEANQARKRLKENPASFRRSL